MPEFIRSIATRLRQYMGDRRRAPRYKLHLEARLALSVTVPNSINTKGRAGQQLRLAGYTRDVSESGIALIMPAVRIGGQYITGDNRALQIVLKLPTGQVEITGTPVRYSLLEDEEEDAEDTGYLIGVRIDSMSDEDRATYNAYIQKLAKRTEE